MFIEVTVVSIDDDAIPEGTFKRLIDVDSIVMIDSASSFAEFGKNHVRLPKSHPIKSVIRLSEVFGNDHVPVFCAETLVEIKEKLNNDLYG